MDAEALLLSARLAAATTAILLALGVPLAWGIARTRLFGRTLVEAFVALPLVLPPTVLGFWILVGLGPRSPLGRAWEALTGSPLVFSFSGLLVASVLSSVPFTVQPLVAAFSAVDERLLEAARCLGASPAGAFLRVALPMSARSVVSAGVLTFAHTVGEFGVVLMVGGSLPGRTRTASISVYDDVQALDFARAGRTSLVLLAFSFAVLAAAYSLQRRGEARGEDGR